ncbi:MAG: sugar ABC transporter substrate-binding protein [Frankia sp.]
MFTRHRRVGLLAAGAACALALAACGSSSSGGTSGASSGTNAGSGTSTGQLSAAKAGAAKYRSVPTSIVQSTPLTSAPPKKKVAFVACADPNCANLATFFKQAATALGWDTITVSATATDPGSAIQQAIDAGANYIATTGYPVALYQTKMNEAKAKNIPVFMCYSTDVPGGPSNNLYSDCNDSSAAAVYAKAMADYLAVDSGGKGNILAVTIPSYPILSAQVTAAKDELSTNCAGCKFHSLEVTTDDLAGSKVPQAVASYLQSNPSINYVYFTYNGLETGVPAALKAAGLASKVKLVGTQGNQPQFQEVASGTSKAWTALPEELAMWTMADQMARLSVKQWSSADERKAAIPPFYFVDTPAAATAVAAEKAGWPGPTGFQETFKKLWGA